MMAKLTRRGCFETLAAAGALRSMGVTIAKPPMRRILTLVCDKGLGIIRAVENWSRCRCDMASSATFRWCGTDGSGVLAP